MRTLAWNFSLQPRLHALQLWMRLHRFSQPRFELRSLPGVCLDEILRRLSSSSLPPLFVLGRFAVFFTPNTTPARAMGV
ncbi:MAG: hypothetical protein RLZZ352_1441 [Pseudomonadota bacterium]|jgi:hypothetical protein